MWFGICFWFLSFITALGKVGHCPNAVEFHINKVASYEILIAIQGKSLVSNALFKQCCVGVLFLLVLTGAMSCYSVTVMIIVRAALHTFTFQRDQEALVYWSVLIVLAFVIKVQITFCFSIGFFFFFFLPRLWWQLLLILERGLIICFLLLLLLVFFFFHCVCACALEVHWKNNTEVLNIKNGTVRTTTESSNTLRKLLFSWYLFQIKSEFLSRR